MSDYAFRQLVRLVLLAMFAAIGAYAMEPFKNDLGQLEQIVIASILTLLITEIILSHWRTLKGIHKEKIDDGRHIVRDIRPLFLGASIVVCGITDYKSDMLQFDRWNAPAICGTIELADSSLAHFDGGCTPLVSTGEFVYGWLAIASFALSIILSLWVYWKPLQLRSKLPSSTNT